MPDMLGHRRPMSCMQRGIHVLLGAAVMYSLLQLFGTSDVQRSSGLLARVHPGLVGKLLQERDPAPSAARAADALLAEGTWRELRASSRSRVKQTGLVTHGASGLPSRSACPDQVRSISVADVAFGILTSDRFIATRLLSQQQTWLKQARDVVFYSESEIDSLPTVSLQPSVGEELVGSGAWKNFPALMDLHQRFPSHKWVFFSDDDTFVYVRNLLARLSHYDWQRDYYIGLYWTPRIDMEWREVHIAYASGGAGYVLSRQLLSRLSAVMRTCHKNYTRWAGDVRVGKCVVDLGVQITPEVGFHHEAHDKYQWDSSGGGFPYGHLSSRASASVSAPVSFHHLTPDQMHFYYRMQMVEERGPAGETYRYDFGIHSFKEFIGYSPDMGYSFRILFGVSVEVARCDVRAEAPAWRRDFADPLYIKRLPGEATRGDDAPLFHMVIAKAPEIFNGDGCPGTVDDPYRSPVRKAVDVVIQCSPCKKIDGGPDEPAGMGRICDAWKEDPCTLKLLLALICPQRQLVYAPSLDIGSRPNAHDLVYMGAPRSCSRHGGGLATSFEHTDASRPAVLYLSVTHGSLSLTQPRASASPDGCAVNMLDWSAWAEGVVLRRSRGSRELVLKCTCERPGQHAAQPPTVLANITVWVHPSDHSPVVFTYAQACPVQLTTA